MSSICLFMYNNFKWNNRKIDINGKPKTTTSRAKEERIINRHLKYLKENHFITVVNTLREERTEQVQMPMLSTHLNSSKKF